MRLSAKRLGRLVKDPGAGAQDVSAEGRRACTNQRKAEIPPAIKRIALGLHKVDARGSDACGERFEAFEQPGDR